MTEAGFEADVRSGEIQAKLAFVREVLKEEELDGVRFRGTDAFAWITAGADATVLLAAEAGVAEVFVTRDAAIVLTDVIEAERLVAEELTLDFEVVAFPWADVAARASFVGTGRVASDRPEPGELAWPERLTDARRVLCESERNRYRRVGRLAAEAMTEVLMAARPHWSERDLAGAGARALWGRGLHPALTLVAGESRLSRFRHPTPTDAPLGARAMLVFCARGAGLYANLTRFVAFSPLDASELRAHDDVRRVEAAILRASRPGARLADLYGVLAGAYAECGREGAFSEHHQGGTTGYRARETVATPTAQGSLHVGSAVAWNPSVRGAKIEDTFLLTASQDAWTLERLTHDPAWPESEFEGRARPRPLVRAAP